MDANAITQVALALAAIIAPAIVGAVYIWGRSNVKSKLALSTVKALRDVAQKRGIGTTEFYGFIAVAIESGLIYLITKLN